MAADVPLRYLHPDARFLMGVEVAKIAASPFAATLRKHLSESPSLPPFDLLTDVDRIVISSPGPAKSHTSEPPFLVVITGRFDLDKLKQLAASEGEIIARYGSVELIAPAHGKTASLHFALVSSNMLLGGDAVSIREALDRRMQPAQLPTRPELLRRASALAATSDIWISGQLSPEELPLEWAPAAAMLADVRGVELAITLQQGLGVRLMLNAPGADAATRLKTTLMSLKQLAAAQKPGLSVLNGLTITATGPRVAASLQLDPESLQRAVAQLGISAVRQARQAAQPKQEDPPRQRSIRIVGAEGGPVEIPFDSQSRP